MRFTTQNIYHINGPQFNYNFPRPLCWDRIGYGKARYDVAEIFAGLDIETTTIDKDGSHLAFAYHFQLSIGTPRVLNVYLCRKWEDIISLLDAIADFYQLDEKHHIILGVANLGFEFQFFRRRLEWDEGEFDFFAKEKYQPLRATYRGIEFREILSITGGNLAQLAKDYCHTQKLVAIDENGRKVSDLDYKKVRNSTTPLTPLEEQYCINDVVIVSEFMWYLFNEFIRPEHYIPMTFTGILHREFKAELKTICKKRDEKYQLPRGESYDAWVSFIHSLQPSEEDYITYMAWLFRGGYVHGNALYSGVDGLLAKMRDITSHYPTRMNLDYFPMSPFKPLNLNFSTIQEVNAAFMAAIKSKCVIMLVEFDYIRTTTTHTIESKSKIPFYTNAKFDNGRLISADLIRVWLTEKDFKIYQWFYKWEGMTIIKAYTAKRGKLPTYVLNVLNRHYKEKERLKAAGLNDTTEYAIAKSRVNTAYGDLVKKLRFLKTTYNNSEEWHEDPTPVNYDKEVLKAILSPMWGIYVTAGARYEILSIVYKLTKAGCINYYTDTDSNKYKPSHKAEQIFKHYNASIYRHRKNRKLRAEYFNGLGEFDKECKGRTVKFKMLGAKRYIYEDQGYVKATIAGMPKASIMEVGDDSDEIFKNFNLFGFHLTPEESGKLTTEYTDEEYTAVIDGESMTELSGVALYEIPFTLSIKDDYTAHIAALKAQYEREHKYYEFQENN